MTDIITLITNKTGLSTEVVQNIITLIEEGNTIPFIARYRKEMTNGASDTQLREFEELYEYQQKLIAKKADILRILEEKEVLTPELHQAIEKAQTLARLDDIYRPFKDKKNTRATKAIAKGLQALADFLLACVITKDAFLEEAKKFIKDTDDEKTSVKNIEEAIQ